MAAFPNTPIQRDYNRYFRAGMPGMLAAIENNNYFYETATASVELLPSDGVYLDVNGEWAKPANDGEANLVTHIMSFEQNDINTPLASPTTNQTSQVIIPAGTPLTKAIAQGAIYVLAGESILRGQGLQYNVSTGLYGPIVDATTAKVAMIALNNAENGGLVAVRINRISAS